MFHIKEMEVKNIVSKTILAAALIFGFQTQALAEVLYTFDPSHTFVLWHINHFGFSNPTGKWMAEGTLMLDEAKLQDSKVKVNIAMNSINTGIDKLDEHLRSPDFFDVHKYPVAIFVSDKVERVGKDRAKVHGMLTLHGVTKPLVLDVKLNKAGIHPITNKKTLGFSAEGKLKRSDFGIDKYIPGLGDEVKLDIEVEANTNS